jgi:thioredoxin-related protein
MRKAIVLFSTLLISLCLISYTVLADKIHWLSVDELQEAYAKEPRPIIIDVYTSWCGWCKVMDANTYNNDSVAAYINKHYYAVKFDAETKIAVKWRGRNFQFNQHYNVNEFSLFITNGQMSYPTTVLMAGIDQSVSPLSGYFKPGELEGPLKYIGSGTYKTENYPDFIKTFSATW